MRSTLPLLIALAGCPAGTEGATVLEICVLGGGGADAFASQDPDGSALPLGVRAEPCGSLVVEPGVWFVRLETGDPTCPVPWEEVDVPAGRTTTVDIDPVANCFDG